jgi:uncharacterized membrane protein
MTTLAAIAVLVLSGVTAGVLFCVALSVVPAFLALPPERYVETHKAIGRNFDRVMPPIVIGSALLDAVLAAAGNTPGRWLFAAAAAMLLGVSVVSQLGNVPINRRVKRLAPGRLPADWRDPRRRWHDWHLLRTVFALVALVLNAVAIVLNFR